MFKGNCHGYGQPQPHMNYNRHNSGCVATIAENPCHGGGGAVQHHAVHKEVFQEVDGGKPRGHSHHHHQQVHHHGGGGRRHEVSQEGYNGHHHGGEHRYGAYENNCEEEYAGRHHGDGRGRYEAYEKTCEESYSGRNGSSQHYEVYESTCEEEVVTVAGGGCAQRKLGYGLVA